MRPDIAPGGTFPDYELPDHANVPRRLSELQGDDPLILPLVTPLLAILSTMLERVQAKRDEAGGIVAAPDAEHAAFLAELIVVERIGRQQVH